MAESRFSRDRERQTEKEQQMIQLVGFMIEKKLFGVNILMVQEVIRGVSITPVPNSPAFVEGVINRRGSILPVVDLRKRLNLFDEAASSAAEKNWILILDIQGKVTGFVVDAVTEVITIEASAIESPAEIIVTGLDSRYIQGVCDIDEQLLILLNFDRILPVEEPYELHHVGDGLNSGATPSDDGNITELV